MPTLLRVSLILALLAAGGCGTAATTTTAAAQAAVAVTRGTLTVSVAATGRVVANLEVEIKCKASGEVTTLPVDVSDTVARGDLILELKPLDEERLVRQSEASLQASRAKLEQARINLAVAERTLSVDRQKSAPALAAAEARARDARNNAERIAKLREKKIASPQEGDAAEATAAQAASDLLSARLRMDELATQELALGLRRQDVLLAESQVRGDEISLEMARQRLTDTKVHSPIDGVVSARLVQIGQIIASGVNNVGGGTTVLTLSDLSRRFVVAAVDETDIGRVTVGQPVAVTADAFPERRFKGRVVQVATKGVNSSNVVTFDVKIELLDAPELKPEMTANVEIELARAENALLLPAEAVRRAKGRRFVLVPGAPGTKPEERAVTVGLTDGTTVQILEGLAEGDKVAASSGAPESRFRSQRGPGNLMMMGGGGGRGH